MATDSLPCTALNALQVVVNGLVQQLELPPLKLDVHVDYNKTRVKASISIIMRQSIDHCAGGTSKFSARPIASVECG